MPRKAKQANAQAVNTAVTNPGAIFNNITLPQPSGEDKKGPKLEIVEVGPFRLKGVKVDINQFTNEQYQEMIVWAKENNAYIAEDKGLFSWKSEAKRDWFILRWS